MSDEGRVQVRQEDVDGLRFQTLWRCEKWSEDACEFVRKKLDLRGAVSSVLLERYVGMPDIDVVEVPGNLGLNEGIDRLLDLLIGAGGTAFNNANAFIGVGDTNTAAAASQTELQATQNAANRFYKAMNATFPVRTAESVEWKSDFTTSEANFVWAEWTIAAGATTASGGGFLVGTINLNRKVQALGTKTTGTWTMSGTVTCA
jgi:hypothetical protein